MSYEDLMARIARDIPELAGKLSAPRVTYVKSSRKTYITFNSSVLAGEKQFLQLEAILREMFPGTAAGSQDYVSRPEGGLPGGSVSLPRGAG